ncbi:hypothetical protein [Candidatus Poriferisocius sp.]|uniref:hypothetical protein n=1 Tax=Candidatus Poriferisocius sp. TaxID=3101276 RepID=UPI003B51B591
MLNQLIRAGRLDRGFYLSLLYDREATGNAVLVVLVAGLLSNLRTLSVAGLAFALLGALFRAVIVSGAVWAVSTYLLGRPGDPQATFRMVGFANVAFFPLVVGDPGRAIGLLALLVAALWFFMALRLVASVQFDLEHPVTLLVALAGMLGWYLTAILF